MQARIPHPEWRQRPKPVNFEEVKLNPPVFFWPVSIQKDEKEEFFSLEYQPLCTTEQNTEPKGIRIVKKLQGGLFTPQEILAPGLWQWRCKRESADTWPPWNSFIVPEETFSYAAMAPHVFIKRCRRLARPRKLLMGLSEKTLHGLEETPDVKALIQEAEQARGLTIPADKELEEVLPVGNSWNAGMLLERTVKPPIHNILVSVHLLLQAFLLNGNRSFLDEAIKQGRQIAALDPNGITAKNDFSDSGAMAAMAVLYDTAFPYLSAELKEDLLQKIRIRGNRIFKRYRGTVESRVMENHAWQHILRRLAFSGLAILDNCPEGEEWLSYVYQVWRGRFPILGGDDGGWANGNGYFPVNFESIAYISLFFSLISNANWAEHPWFQNVGKYLALTMPPGTTSDRFGDQCEKYNYPSMDRVAFADVIHRFTNNPTAREYAQRCLTCSQQKLESDKKFRWFRILMDLTDKERNIFPDRHAFKAVMPQDGFFPDTGISVFHSDINVPRKNIMVSFRSSPFGAFGHAHANQNAFNINLGGKPLFVTAGYYTGFSNPHTLRVYRNTWGQNSILINGAGQKLGTENFAQLYNYGTLNECSWVTGDASAAYGKINSEFWIERLNKAGITPVPKNGYGSEAILQYKRTVLFIRPGLIIIYDNLEAERKASWQWLLHSPWSFIESDKSLSFHAGPTGKEAEVTLTGSCSLTHSISNKFPIEPENNYSKQWHLTVQNKNEQSKMRFLAVIDLNSAVAPYNHSTLKLLKQPENITAASWKNWTVQAELDTNKKPRLILQSTEIPEGVEINGQ